jgi:hypothetical protein
MPEHNMPRYPAVDSNALTYLIEAVQEDYDLASDVTGLGVERGAMLRCYFYGDCSFWVPPTVQREYARIGNANWRSTHARWAMFILQDTPLRTPAQIVDDRAMTLMKHHKKEDDCRVVAETECANLDVLLSCDQDLQSRLSEHTPIRIMRPTQFWASLGIGAGARPIIYPAPKNPLALKTWWRLPEA